MARPFGELIQEIEDETLHKPEDDMRPRIRRWLNRSQREILSAYNFTFAEVEKTTPSTLDNPGIYVLDDDYEALIDIRIQDADGVTGTPLIVEPTRRKDLLVPDQAATPAAKATAVTVTGGALLMTPAFDNVDHKIVARYYRSAPEMKADDDRPLIPTNFTNVLLDGALILGDRWVWDDKGNRDRIKRDFVEGIKKMVRKEKGDIDRQDKIRIDNALNNLVRGSGAAFRSG